MYANCLYSVRNVNLFIFLSRPLGFMASSRASSNSCELTSVILDEVLCFIFNQHDVIAATELSKICAENFDPKAIFNAKSKLFSFVPSIRLVKKHKAEDNVSDMISLFCNKDLLDDVSLPIFAAQDLSKLPSVAPFHVDSSQMLTAMRKLQVELNEVNSFVANSKNLEKELKSLKSEIASIASLKAQFDGFRSELDCISSTCNMMHVQSESRFHSETTNSKSAVVPETMLRVHLPSPVAPETRCPPTSQVVDSNPVETSINPNAPVVSRPAPISYLGNATRGPGPAVSPERSRPESATPAHTDRTSSSDRFQQRSEEPDASASEGEWQKVKVKPRRFGINIGARSGARLRCIAPKPKHLAVFVSRLTPETTERDMLDFVREAIDKNAHVTVLKTRYASYKSFKVVFTADSSSARRVLSPQLWPEGALVRRFFERRDDA